MSSSSRLLVKALRQRRGRWRGRELTRSRFVSFRPHSSLAVSSNEDVAKSFVRSLRSKQAPLPTTTESATKNVLEASSSSSSWIGASVPATNLTHQLQVDLTATSTTTTPPVLTLLQEDTADLTGDGSVSPWKSGSQYDGFRSPEASSSTSASIVVESGADNERAVRARAHTPFSKIRRYSFFTGHDVLQKRKQKDAKPLPQQINLDFLKRGEASVPMMEETDPLDCQVSSSTGGDPPLSELPTVDESIINEDASNLRIATVPTAAIETGESPETTDTSQLTPSLPDLPPESHDKPTRPTTILVDAVASMSFVDDEPSQSDATENPPHRSSRKKRKSLRQAAKESGKESIAHLYYHMHQYRGQRRAMQIYRNLLHDKVNLQSQTIRALFRLSSPRSPFDMYELLQHFLTFEDTHEFLNGDGDMNSYVHFYERVCYSVRYLDFTNSNKVNAEELVQSVAADLRTLDPSGQEKCYPTFVSSLLQQKWVRVGMYAKEFYEEVVDQKFAVADGWYNHLLSLSLFNRQKDLDFADVALRSVKSSVKPRGVELITALENFFPFDDVEGVEVFLESILELRKSSPDPDSYNVDLNTLEQIGCAAARYGDTDVNLLIWDIVDSQKSAPTVGIYENTTTAFACNPFTFREAFVVLLEMEANGFKPSRALIRTLSTRMRTTAQDLTFAIEQLRQLGLEGKCITQAALNVLVSCAGERGDVRRLVDLYTQFDHYKVEPNADTFSFVFEALGKRVRRNVRTERAMSPRHVEAYIVTADSFIQSMEDKGIHPTHHIIRDYVEFLCHMDQVGTANEVVFAVKGDPSLVGSKTLYRLAMANAKQQQFDIAREIANFPGAPSAMRELTLRNIAREERCCATVSEDASTSIQPEIGAEEPTTFAT